MKKTTGLFVLAFCVFLLALYTRASAQSGIINISGRVTDIVTEDELPDVTIYITDRTKGSTDSTLTDAGGRWEYALVTSIVEEQNMPARFQVSRNYPNPFNPSTTIDISLPAAGEVEVSVYNILGEVIESKKEYLGIGDYSIDWSAPVSAGLYFIHVRTAHGSVTRKVTLLDGGFGSGLSGFRPAGSESNRIPKIPASVPVRIEASKFAYVPHTVETVVEGGEYFDIAIETIHSAAFVADLHNDVLEKMIHDPEYHWAELHDYNHTDIPRLITGGVDLQLFVVWANPRTHLHDSFDHVMDMIGIFHSEVSLNASHVGQARTRAEALALHDENKISAVLCVEGGHAIENDIEKLKALHSEGMRYLTITWNNSTDWAVSARDSRSETVGLSEFGERVIRTLDTLGVIIDISHTGIKTIEDILDVTGNPIIASHSNARALREHYRNLYDDQIIAIASSGGVIGVVFYPPFISNIGYANIDYVAQHIDYIVGLVGIDHVGLGSDFDGIGDYTVDGLEDVSKFPDLTLELLRRGYSRADVEKILGGNFLRVFEQVCGE